MAPQSRSFHEAYNCDIEYAIICDIMFVFDTNVLVAAFRSKQGASYTILSGIVEGTIPAMASVALLLEYEDVLSRDEQLQHFWQSADEIEKVMNLLAMRL